MEPWNTKEASLFWKNELGSYGKSDYVNSVLDLIIAQKPQVIFELSIGNGYSFVDNLIKEGIKVHGCDISEFFINELHESHPSVVSYQAGYDDFVKSEQRNFFDVVYCVRSSWYFSDIYLAIDNMVEITKPGGKIIIDIMNADSSVAKSSLRACKIKRIKQRCKNIIKYILNTILKQKYVYETVFNNDKAVKPSNIEKYLNKKNLSYEKFCFEQMTTKENLFVDDSMRYLYIITKL